MIIDALWGVLTSFFAFVLDLFPAFSPPTIGGSCEGYDNLGCLTYPLGKYLSYLHNWIDIHALSQVIGWVLLAFVAANVVKAAVWLYGLIPGKSA